MDWRSEWYEIKAMRSRLWLALLVSTSCSPQRVLLGSYSEPEPDAGLAGSAGATLAEARLVGSVDLTDSGPGIRLLMGDVSGDGRNDIVAMQPDTVPDGKTPHAVMALTAFELDGTRLWQLGTPNPDGTGSASDIPAQIYDIDGDGFNEVLAVMNDRFLVIDGRTGQIERDHELPDPNAHDAIIIANLSGHGHPDDVLLKDRFSTLWAFDRDFQPLFTFQGPLSYFPWPYDWDEDGKDEIMAACQFLDDDGTLLWSCEDVVGDEQVDSVWAADIDPERDNGTEIILGAGDVLVFDLEKNLRFRVDTTEAQNVVVGEFRPDLEGLEIGGLDRIQRGDNGTDGMFLISSTGDILFREDRPAGSGWSTIVTRMRDWASEDRDLVVAYGREGAPPALYNGRFEMVASFVDETGQLIPVDLCGDDRQELVAFTDQVAHVYAIARCDLNSHVTGEPRPQPKVLYNWTRYWGGEVP